ncbi:NAD(P)-binding Rossmann-like domain-containing protein [Klenkia marina]|uniref:NAD(P)-binding Rossmann-like domain-containing protein n=1 Tax=Klenkia marina TaxID=1960309 RepID=A0A1G4XAM1_9ACTN|nr:NAD(P)-binding protein [Klenkia marina]SCX38289.1 NAD(P)-binding Rossmann-like domain-containing protein [Klenkia marina]
MPDALLVGANLAALVAAGELAAAGQRVTLLTDGRPPGGHFAGLVVDGVAFDTGMVTLERPASGAQPVPALSGYDPDRRYDWTRYAAAVDRWQAGRVELRRTPTPQVLVAGRRHPDHLMTDRLDVLAGAEPPAPLLDRADPRHAADKTTGKAYDELPYREAARANHGPDVQARLVDPFLDSVLGSAAEHLLARHHRSAWLPLYWPATVAAATDHRPTPVPEHAFWTTDSGLVAQVVTGLHAELAAHPLVTLDHGPVRSVRREGDALRVHTDGAVHDHPAPAVGLPRDRARELLGLPPVPVGSAAPVAVLCCLVRADAVRDPAGCLLVVDPAVVAYRVTDQDAQAGRDRAWRRVTVEAGAAGQRLADSGGDLARRLVEDLVGLLGLPHADPGAGGTGHPDVRVLRLLRAPRALAVPTAASVAADRRSRDELLGAGAVPTGGLLGTGLNSLADQVVQGLALAERFG